jgi:choline-glycine betaine transporter
MAEGEKKRTWQNAEIKDKSIRIKFCLGNKDSKWSPRFDFNPVVSVISFLLILVFVIWCILDTDNATSAFGDAKSWITDCFTWLYVGSQDFWALVIIIIYFSKYGNMKLGKDDEEPEYNDATWFAMLFACGVGVGLFFYGVAEPIWHYTGGNRYFADKYMPDNELAQNAMNLTFFHWGIHGWIVYVVVGLLLAFTTYRKGMKMTMKSCFYPLLGDRIFGWMGDCIDILSIITTLFGVCTSLGLGVMQINAGLNYVNENIAINTDNQVIIIWCITAIATCSTVSGVGMGIRRLSEICFTLGMFMMMAVLLLEDTWYILNLFCQSIGFYIQWIIQLGFHCDAFEMAYPSYGGKTTLDDGVMRSTDIPSRSRAYDDMDSDGPANWMDGWTIFYWGWWISWSPFVGMFIAQISRGRTIRQFINGTMTAPVLYSIIWFSIFGGAAILEERQAASPDQNLCCASWNTTISSAVLTDEYSSLSTETDYTNWDIMCGSTECNDCETYWMGAYSTNYSSIHGDTLGDFVTFLNDRRHRWGMYNYDESHVRLSCLGTTSMWFAMMNTYGDLGTFLCIVSMAAIILYFVTSSDSGSLIIDILAANGMEDPPRAQRVFWALCEGATATALLVAGGTDALGALQTVSIITGLPYTIILCFLCISLWRALAMEMGDIDPYGPDFLVSVIDPITTFAPKLWLALLKNIFITPFTLYKVMTALGSGVGNSISIAMTSFICWLLWIILLILQIEVEGSFALGWVFYLGFVTCITITRHKVRLQNGINGNPVEDFFCALFLYPCTAVQLEVAVSPRGKGLTTLMPAPADVLNYRDVVVENPAAEKSNQEDENSV